MFNTEEGKQLFKWVRVVAILLVVFLAVKSVYVLRATGELGKDVPPTSMISVSGESEVFAVPDTASLSFGATAFASTVSDAQQEVTKKINAALDMLKKAGIEEKDIKNTDYSISPHYEYPQIYCIKAPCPSPRQTLTGYDVTQTVSVKIRDTKKVGDILGNLGELGLSNVSGVTFTIDDEDGLRADAREKAIKMAQEKAEKLADDLDVSLGRIVSFSESGDYPMPYAYGRGGDAVMNMAAPEKVSVPVGENKIMSTVTITYEIK